MTQHGAGGGNTQPDFKKEIKQQFAALDKLSGKKRPQRKPKMTSAADIISKSAALAPLATLTPNHRKLFQAAQAIYQEPGDVDNAAWMAHQLVQAELTLQIYRIVRERDLTQAEAAKALGIRQPNVSLLMRNRAGSFSVGRLMEFLTALGHDVEVSVTRSRKEHGEMSVTLR